MAMVAVMMLVMRTGAQEVRRCPIEVVSVCDDLCDLALEDTMVRRVLFTGDTAVLDCLEGTTVEVTATMLK